MTVMEDVYYFTLISGDKLAREHLSICSKYLGKPVKNRGQEWVQKAQTKYVEILWSKVKNRAVCDNC